jgi:hypothetical protein
MSTKSTHTVCFDSKCWFDDPKNVEDPYVRKPSLFIKLNIERIPSPCLKSEGILLYETLFGYSNIDLNPYALRWIMIDNRVPKLDVDLVERELNKIYEEESPSYLNLDSKRILLY